MTFYFDPHHPKQLVEALNHVYGLEKGKPRKFKIYDSTEYNSVPEGSVFFVVDEEKYGLEINTRRLVAEGNVVIAIKFQPGYYYVPFEVADAVLKIWGRVHKCLSQKEVKLFKYLYKSDSLKPVTVQAVTPRKPLKK